jgi:hypothetical protein
MRAAALLLAAYAAASGADRSQELQELLKILRPSSTRITGRISAQDKSWEDWVKRTGELPPDFDALPSVAGLPEPGFASRQEWQRERPRVRALFEQWVYGRMPPAPENLRAVVTGTHEEGGVTVRDVRLEFGPARRATLRVQVMIPPGKGPFPVLLTNHPRTRPWVATAVRRGYIGCIYYAADPMYGNTDDSDAFIEVYPEYDFSCLGRWAWAGMRAVDYLVGLPEVDKSRIAITGHSRNGKQALLAAAFDERIAAVIASSGLTGESNPWRYTTDMFVNETLEQITGNFPHWFHPRLRFFAGREQKLPVDQNLLAAMVAPRALPVFGLRGRAGRSAGRGAGLPLGAEGVPAFRRRRQAVADAARRRARHHGGRYREVRGLSGRGVRAAETGQPRGLGQRVQLRGMEACVGRGDRSVEVPAQGGGRFQGQCGHPRAHSMGSGRGAGGPALSGACEARAAHIYNRGLDGADVPAPAGCGRNAVLTLVFR